MSTRAIYTFKDEHETVHVYKHYDGYPSGALGAIKSAITSGQTWTLPRFEAAEFSAGFIAANKQGQGDIRCVKTRRAYADVQYGYTVTLKDGKPHVTAHAIDGWDTWKEKKIFAGTLEEFEVFAETN